MFVFICKIKNNISGDKLRDIILKSLFQLTF